MVQDYSTDAVPSRARLLGTCARIADRSGINVTLLRVLAIVALLAAFKLAVITYCVGALAFRMERR